MTPDEPQTEEQEHRVLVKGEASYWRMKARVLAFELTEEIPGIGKVGDFVIPHTDDSGGVVYSRDEWFEHFERVMFFEDPDTVLALQQVGALNVRAPGVKARVAEDSE